MPHDVYDASFGANPDPDADADKLGSLDDFLDLGNFDQEFAETEVHAFAEQFNCLPQPERAEPVLELYPATETKETAPVVAPEVAPSPEVKLQKTPSGTPSGTPGSAGRTQRGTRRKIDAVQETPQSVQSDKLDSAGPDSVGPPSQTKRKRARATGAKGEKTEKGLRTFATKVCNKVQEKGHTTYNSVADELVSEGDLEIDDKNIRRRVYDALNVLKAMDIIAQDKKAISWKGLPSVTCSMDQELQKRNALLRKIQEDRTLLQEQLDLHACYVNLVKHNLTHARAQQQQPGGARGGSQPVRIPFTILGECSTKTSAESSMSFAADNTSVEIVFSHNDWMLMFPPDLLLQMHLNNPRPSEFANFYELCDHPNQQVYNMSADEQVPCPTQPAAQSIRRQ